MTKQTNYYQEKVPILEFPEEIDITCRVFGKAKAYLTIRGGLDMHIPWNEFREIWERNNN